MSYQELLEETEVGEHADDYKHRNFLPYPGNFTKFSKVVTMRERNGSSKYERIHMGSPLKDILVHKTSYKVYYRMCFFLFNLIEEETARCFTFLRDFSLEISFVQKLACAG